MYTSYEEYVLFKEGTPPARTCGAIAAKVRLYSLQDLGRGNLDTLVLKSRWLGGVDCCDDERRCVRRARLVLPQFGQAVGFVGSVDADVKRLRKQLDGAAVKRHRRWCEILADQLAGRLARKCKPSDRQAGAATATSLQQPDKSNAAFKEATHTILTR